MDSSWPELCEQKFQHSTAKSKDKGVVASTCRDNKNEILLQLLS
jgi:hypothetical protein